MSEIARLKRVVAYIDGFNLYFGMKDSGWQRYYWLNVYRLAELILPPNTALMEVKYCTARVTAAPDKQKRQATYLDALELVTPCLIILGEYKPETTYCSSCYREYRVYKEKMTDVNIAVEMMKDAFQDKFDIALVISGDSDLTPPIAATRQLFPEKAVIVAFPPNRNSKELKQHATSHFVISRANLRDSQLDDEITKPDGYVLKRPVKWTNQGE